jgi:hypothetical protein
VTRKKTNPIAFDSSWYFLTPGKADAGLLVPADLNFIFLPDVIELARLRQGNQQFGICFKRMGQQSAVGTVKENIFDDHLKSIQIG